MRRYFDTSLLVAALIREAGTAAAKTYLTGCGTEPWLISRLDPNPLAVGTAEKDDCKSSIPGCRRLATIAGVASGRSLGSCIHRSFIRIFVELFGTDPIAALRFGDPQ
jgi:hypothetical protein